MFFFDVGFPTAPERFFAKSWAEMFFGQGQPGQENLEPILKVTWKKKTEKKLDGKIKIANFMTWCFLYHKPMYTYIYTYIYLLHILFPTNHSPWWKICTCFVCCVFLSKFVSFFGSGFRGCSPCWLISVHGSIGSMYGLELPPRIQDAGSSPPGILAFLGSGIPN